MRLLQALSQWLDRATAPNQVEHDLFLAGHRGDDEALSRLDDVAQQDARRRRAHQMLAELNGMAEDRKLLAQGKLTQEQFDNRYQS